MPLHLTDTDIVEVKRVTAQRFDDERGWFMEAFHQNALATLGMGRVEQINHAFSRAEGTVRGLHFQEAPFAQGKLVRCLHGSIADVAVDVRPGRNQGNWVLERLEAPNQMLWVPPGFAHGFQTLAPDTQVEYTVTDAAYAPDAERVLRWNDPALGIPWPIEDAVVNQRDSAAPRLVDLVTS